MPASRRGEVWLADLGMIAKVRPVLVISIELIESDRALVGVVPHTTSVRGTRFEVATQTPFLERGAFDTQNLVTIPQTKLIRRLGRLSDADFANVLNGIQKWLGLI